MRWDDGHESEDLIDRRGEDPNVGGGGGSVGGLFFLLPWLLRSKVGWLVIVVVVGYGVWQTFGGGAGTTLTGGATHGQGSGSHVTDSQAHFVAFVLDDVQQSWQADFASRGKAYPHAKLVLFTTATQTACGVGKEAMGPFYCPRDQYVYIDLAFYQELEQRLGARGQFAKAYVIAHEIGHHVQHLLGTDAKVGSHAEGADSGSVRLELQADCYAGIWAHTTSQRDILEKGDIESALNAAAAIGDDKLQRDATGRVRPETFTHGTSAERVRWFQTGYQSGKLEACDTFAARTL
jgi:predicted metalloprotease